MHFGPPFLRIFTLTIAGSSFLFSAPVELSGRTADGAKAEQHSVEVEGKRVKLWDSGGNSGSLIYRPGRRVTIPDDGTIYGSVSYLDHGYGRLDVHITDKTGKVIRPDRFLGMARTNSGKIVTAQMRFADVQKRGNHEIALKVDAEAWNGTALAVETVILQDEPFEDANFKFTISDPWKGPYRGPTVKPADNTTLKGKAMTGYQGWFRTPNDPDGRGWSHWGNIEKGTFSVDMWPDVSQYPKSVLEKAGDLKLKKSGSQAYLFSSAWPDVVKTHFRWMRENDIDGAFMQRFVNDHFYAISGKPERVLSNIRTAANQEGRIWAIEYDVSGYQDARLLETMKKDWKWLVDEFRLLDDPNYAREGKKPVVFIWGLPFPNRNYQPSTANAVVDFFKNDPVYGGNYVIGGIPGNWRDMDAAWKEHFKQYHCVLSWMSPRYAEDLADFRQMGLSYYAHVKPGFSWANLKHLPTGDLTVEHTPRKRGQFYWDQLSRSAQAGCDRMFVGMFDEYDEATAIMPMSDDTPPTPSRPGVAATFYRGENADEHGQLVHLKSTAVNLSAPPTPRVPADHFFMRMGGLLSFPSDGTYIFSVEGAPGDDVDLTINGEKILRAKNSYGTATSATGIIAKAGEQMPFRLEYRHRKGEGTVKLAWEAQGIQRQEVPANFLTDAWGHFIDNEGQPADWWMKLTQMGKEMMNGKKPPDSPMP